MASAEADRLKKFKCAAGRRYQLPEEWYYVDDNGDKYFNVSRALTDFENFITAVRSCVPSQYAAGTNVDVSTFNNH